MTNLCVHPFLSSLVQAAQHTGDYQEYKALLLEQHISFEDCISEYFKSGKIATKRFFCLRIADEELYQIHKTYGKKIKESNADFYRFWSELIDNTRRFIAISVETLRFQTKCSPQMLAEEDEQQSIPLCKWTAQRSDLMEIIVGVYLADIIRMPDGNAPSFSLFARAIGHVFGHTFKNPHEEMRKILLRKKNQTPFLNRIISILKDKNENSQR